MLQLLKENTFDKNKGNFYEQIDQKLVANEEDEKMSFCAILLVRLDCIQRSEFIEKR